MGIREVVDRKIEVGGSHGWLQFRLVGGKVHVTAVPSDLPQGAVGQKSRKPLVVGLGDFSADEIREALGRL